MQGAYDRQQFADMCVMCVAENRDDNVCGRWTILGGLSENQNGAGGRTFSYISLIGKSNARLDKIQSLRQGQQENSCATNHSHLFAMSDTYFLHGRLNLPHPY